MTDKRTITETEYARFVDDINTEGHGYALQRLGIEVVPDPVVLPTEPGYYVDANGDAWYLDPQGVWRLGSVTEPSISFAPFKRLYTIDDVLDTLEEHYGIGKPRWWNLRAEVERVLKGVE